MLNGNISLANSNILTEHNFDKIKRKSYILSTENETEKYIKVFEFHLKQGEHLGTTWLINSCRGGHNSMLIDINIRTESVASPTITVITDKYNSINNLVDFYYKSSQNDVIEIYLKLKVSYVTLNIFKVFSNRIINENYSEFTQFAQLTGTTQIVPKNKYNISFDNANISGVNSGVAIVNKTKYLDKIMNISLIVTVNQSLPTYANLCVLGDNTTTLATDIPHYIYNTTVNKIIVCKANSNGILIILGNNTLDVGTYHINISLPLS